MTKEKRREPRYSIRFPARLHWKNRMYVSLVEDVSNRGMCVRTDATPPLRLLVRVELELPDNQHTLTMHAMVAHTTAQDGCPQPAIGLELYGVAAQERAAWEAFVRRIRLRNASPPVDEEVSFITSVEPASNAALKLVRARAAAGSGMYVDTSLPVRPGTALHTAVVHPEDQRKMFLLEGVVRKNIEQEDRRGAIIDICKLDRERLERLTDFIEREDSGHLGLLDTIRMSKALRIA
jgi:hypothetical protein